MTARQKSGRQNLIIKAAANTDLIIKTFINGLNRILTYSGTWYPVILEECNGSEEKALNRFFEYLNQFDRETKNRN